MTFKCWNCKRDSAFSKEATRLIVELKTLSFGDETRRYGCEHCGKSNSITMASAEWMQIDLKSR
jgi:DNA-directed RNA polymerase subunit RPC12/RpoP